MPKYFWVVLVLGLFFILPSATWAADIFLVSDSGDTYGIGQEFVVNIKVDTKDDNDGINASQATINFSSDVLEVVELNRNGSAFGFWVEEPSFSNKDGKVSFIGGTSKGISGHSLQILGIKFRARGAGQAILSIEDAVVTAADGKGTNVLSQTEGMNIGVGTKVVQPLPVEIPPELLEEPELVTREAIKAAKVPGPPVLRVPLYPKEDRWYNQVGNVKIFWELPDDVLQTATRVSQAKDQATGEKDEQLLTGKNLGVLEEGVWYIRVQFRNNIGWGELAYYKVQIDTTAPLPFEIRIDSEVSDNPSPGIDFETNDSLSGIKEYEVLIDGIVIGTTTSTTFSLPPQKPGEHKAVIKAYDMAGNVIQDDQVFEVFPLTTPTISFVTEVVGQEEFIFASGKSATLGFVDVELVNSRGQQVFFGAFEVDEVGNWEAVIEDPLPSGKYSLLVKARDSRGAVSYATDPVQIKIKAKTVISLGFIDLGWFEILVIVALLAAGGFSFISWRNLLGEKKKGAYATVAVRDVEKLSAILEKDLGDLEMCYMRQKKVDPGIKSEIEALIARLRETLDKMKKYIRKEVEKIN